MSVRSLAPLAAMLCVAAAGPVLASAPQPPSAPVVPRASGPSLQDLARVLVQAGELNDADTLLATAIAMRDHPDFPSLPAELQATIHYLIADNLNARGRSEEALRDAIRATELDPGASGGWFGVMRAHGAMDNMDAVAEALSRGVRVSQQLREEVNGDYVVSLALQDRISDDRAFELLNSLFDSGWRWEHDSYMWLRLVGERLERGDVAGAAEVAPLVTSSGSLIRLHSERRYDPVRERAGLTELDLQSVMDLELEGLRDEATDMDGRQTLASALFSRGRFEEALAVADAGLVDLPADDASSDWDSANWLMDTRARTLMELGRPDDALLQMQRAAGRLENSTRNVSQQINLGWMNLRMGRNEDAMAAVTNMDESLISPYGVMQAVQVRACAAHALGQTFQADEAFAYLAEHWTDAPGAYYDALACRGDVDGMAALMVERLGDPEHSEDAVSDLHTYLPRNASTPFDMRMREAHAAVAARAEVIAARDAVARAMTIPTIGNQF